MGVQHLQNIWCFLIPDFQGFQRPSISIGHPLAKWRCELHRLSMVLARHCHRVGLRKGIWEKKTAMFPEKVDCHCWWLQPVDLPTPLKNDGVTWDDDIPIFFWKFIKIFQTTRLRQCLSLQKHHRLLLSFRRSPACQKKSDTKNWPLM